MPRPIPVADTGAAAQPNLLSQLHNDYGNAERLIAVHGQELRYCHPFKKWLVWDGRRWAPDETGQAGHIGLPSMARQD